MAAPTQSEILDAMQFPHIQGYIPMNGTGDQPFTLTYQFAGNVQPVDNLWNYSGWTIWTEAEKQAIRDALIAIETILNIDFVEVTGQSDPNMNFGIVNMDLGIAGQAGCTAPVGGRWDASVMYSNSYTILDQYGFHVITHEIGHALGLDHPFDDVQLDTAYDNNHYSIMSYTSDPIAGGYLEYMGLYDILALQDIWGAAAYNTGNNSYTGPRSYETDVIWDTGGTDIFDASAITTHAVTLDLQEGHYSTFGSYEDVAIAFGAVIENANGGSMGDTVTGNATDNVLRGRPGDDTLNGLDGKDRLYGGLGNDTLNGNHGQDKLYGRIGADTLYGGAKHDVLRGGKGNDELHGGGGKDKLVGGSGDDMLTGDAGADKFVFKLGFDHDTITDFENDVDALKIGGLGTIDDILAASSEIGGDVVIDFGGGDILTVENITLADLQDDLIIV